MPELPEVERAVRLLRRAAVGRAIDTLRTYHPSLTRRVRAGVRRSLRGARILDVARRGKHQLLHLDDGRTIHVHFRMAGDWKVDTVDAGLPAIARAAISFVDGTRVLLVDPRALSTIDVHPAGVALRLDLGPEPTDPALTGRTLATILAKRRGAIKPVLLDQRVIAGLGNIYAAEALWRARIDPRRGASALEGKEVTRLLAAVRFVIGRATGARYRDRTSGRLDVYGRAAERCRRCAHRVARTVQAGRSTYFCPHCQR